MVSIKKGEEMDEQEKDSVESNNPIDGQIGLEDLYYEMSQKEDKSPEIVLKPLDGQMSLEDLQNISSAEEKPNSMEDNKQTEIDKFEETNDFGEENIVQDIIAEPNDDMQQDDMLSESENQETEEIYNDEQVEKTQSQDEVEQESETLKEEMVGDVELSSLGNIFKENIIRLTPSIPCHCCMIWYENQKYYPSYIINIMLSHI